MKTKEYFLKEVDDIESKITDLERQKENVYAEYAAAYCPFKVGDVITIAGYSHRGKSGVIEGIKIKSGYTENILYWTVFGRVLKKDSSKGEKMFDFSENDYIRYWNTLQNNA